MKKIFIFLVCCLIVTTLGGCKSSKLQNTSSENSSLSSIEEEYTPKTYDYTQIPFEYNSVEEEIETSKQKLKEIIEERLQIGFDTYGIEIQFSTNGKTAGVIGPREEIRVDALFAETEYLETHNIVFNYYGPGELQRYTPPTHESVGIVDGDNFGYVYEKDLPTHTAIKGFSKGTLKIIVDNTFTIIVNP